MKMLIPFMALVAIGATRPSRALAQSSSVADARQQMGCFRGRPLPACKSFWIVEMQVSQPIVQTSRTVLDFYPEYDAQYPGYDVGRRLPVSVYEDQRTAFSSVLEWNLGHMVNLGENFALGGVVTGGTGNGGSGLTGLKMRVRRWVGPDFSVEVEAGAMWGNAQYVERSAGGTAALRFNIRDQGAFYLRWDVLPLQERSRPGEYGHFDPGGTQHALSVGVSAGSVPALVATGTLGVTLAVWIAIFSVLYFD